MEQRLIIKCSHAGISGDLFLSALAEIISLDKMGRFLNRIPSYISDITNISIKLEKKKDHGISGTHLVVNPPKTEKETHIHLDSSGIKSLKPLESESNTPTKMENNGFNNHIDPEWMREKLKAISKGENFSDLAKDYLLACFKIILMAEAAVHDIPMEQVHLHEIGAVDTIIDLAGVTFGMQEIGVFSHPNEFEVIAEPIAVGSGEIKIAHGILPVPAPATQQILSKYELEFSFGPEKGELATPTGVALLAGLKEMGLLTQNSNLKHKIFNIKTIGTGMGTLKLKERANILPIMYVSNPKESLDASPTINPELEWHWKNSQFRFEEKLRLITLIETNIDDMRGELMGSLYPPLFKAGALDISVISAITKKNRPSFLVQIVCPPERRDEIIAFLLEKTTTLGVRFYNTYRICLPRKIIRVPVNIEGNSHQVSVKVAVDADNKIVQYKVEFSDIETLAEKYQVSIIKIEKMIHNQISFKILGEKLE